MTGAPEVDPSELSPSEVRERIAKEHAHLRHTIREVESMASLVLDGDLGALEMLRLRSGQLYDMLCAHIELEDRILAPALRETPGFGEVRETQLLSHHAAQREDLRRALDELSHEDLIPEELAKHVQSLLTVIRVDMKHEDRDLLNDNLLKDDPIDVSFSG